VKNRFQKCNLQCYIKGAEGPEKFPRRFHEFPFFGNGVLGGGLAVEKSGKGGGGIRVKLHIGRSDVWDRRKGGSKAGLYKLNPVYSQLESAWFQPLSL
jgi:hypothetical protein